MTTSSTIKPKQIRQAINKKGPKNAANPKSRKPVRDRSTNEREAYKLVATREQQKEKRDQRDKSSAAYETGPAKEKVDAQNKWECEKAMEESSRFAERHAGTIYWTVCIVTECLVSQELLT